MLSVEKKILEFENCFQFENKIKWTFVIQMSLLHLACVWFTWHYAYPLRLMTFVFFCFMLTINGIGITCGVHRLFTHRSYKVTRPLKIFLLICFATSGQNSVYQWVRDHRLHHKFSDRNEDPHDASRGLFFSHIGWLMMHKNEKVITEGKKIDMSDLESDKDIMFFHKHASNLKIFFCFLLPTLINIYLLGETWKCAVTWQCFLRFLMAFHCELSVNSFAHTYGYTPYNKTINPKQNKYVSMFSLGEGWHNYHHTFPSDYKAAEFFDRYNFSAKLIKFWEKLGWAYDLKEADPKMINSVIKSLGDGVFVERTEN